MCYEERFFLQRATTKVQKGEEPKSADRQSAAERAIRSPEIRDGQAEGSQARAGNRLRG